MANETPNFDPESFLISTPISFCGQEFEVVVKHDGFSYWFDPTVKRQAQKADPNLIGMAMVYDGNERKFLKRLEHEMTIKAPIPEADLLIIRKELSPKYWADDFSCEAQLDAILEPIFWEHVNPYLSFPCQPNK